MKLAMIGLIAAVTVASPAIVSAHGHHRHHHHGWTHAMNRMHGGAAHSDPNGTAGGPTSLSGTGSSKFGGQVPGAPDATRQ